MAILTVPSVYDLSQYSGRPETSYTAFANSALLQAVIQFQTTTELQPADIAVLVAEDAQLANFGILSMADFIYLRQPYAQPIASPFISERIGSYSYSKAQAGQARNAAALEVQGEATGVMFYDLAVRMLAKRTRAGGVFSGSIGVFDQRPADEDQIEIRWHNGRMVIAGPSELNELDALPGGINAQNFPMDPGV